MGKVVMKFATSLKGFAEQGRQKRALETLDLEILGPDADTVQRIVDWRIELG